MENYTYQAITPKIIPLLENEQTYFCTDKDKKVKRLYTWNAERMRMETVHSHYDNADILVLLPDPAKREITQDEFIKKWRKEIERITKQFDGRVENKNYIGAGYNQMRIEALKDILDDYEGAKVFRELPLSIDYVKNEAVNKGFNIANAQEYKRRMVLRDSDSDLYYTGWMECFDWLSEGYATIIQSQISSEDREKLLNPKKESPLDDFPENKPLYKDSGLWQMRTDDMQEIVIQQGVNESDKEFILRCKELKPTQFDN